MAPHSIPKPFYDPVRGLIEAIESATSDVPKADIEGTIKAPIVRFIKHYEQHYYRYQWSRLPACRAQIHLLAHVADAVEWGGLCTSIPCGAVRGCEGLLRKASKTAIRE